MGYQRAHDSVIKERLAHWFLYKKTIPLELAQIVELVEVLSKPVRLPYGSPKRKEVQVLVQAINIMIYQKQHPSYIPPVVENDDES
jgi:hypothetical protein